MKMVLTVNERLVPLKYNMENYKMDSNALTLAPIVISNKRRHASPVAANYTLPCISWINRDHLQSIDNLCDCNCSNFP